MVQVTLSELLRVLKQKPWITSVELLPVLTELVVFLRMLLFLTLKTVWVQLHQHAQLYMSPKIVAHQFDFSELAMEMAQIDDGIGDIRAQMREDMGKHHAEVQNKMLVMPLENYGEVANMPNITNNYTSLYKVISNTAELTIMDSDNFMTDARTVDAFDLYGTNRDTASFLDATVDFGDGYATGDIRNLTLTIINTLLRQLRQEGGSPKVILTGYDTIQTLADLLQSQERFMDRKEIVPTVNGVRGVKGQEVGFRVSTYYDIPLIPVKDIATTQRRIIWWNFGLCSSLIPTILVVCDETYSILRGRYRQWKPIRCWNPRQPRTLPNNR